MSLLDKLSEEQTRRAVAGQLAEESGQKQIAEVAPAMSTAEVYCLHLHRRIQRVAQLASMQAPPTFLVTELLLLIDAAEFAYPTEVASIRAQRMRIRAKEMLGRCVDETCERPAAPGSESLGFCAEHRKRAEEELT